MKPSARFAIGFVFLLTAGCNARQGIPVGPQEASQLEQQVKIYQPNELAGVKYISLGSIDDSACKWMLWDEAPTEQGVTNRLLSKQGP